MKLGKILKAAAVGVVSYNAIKTLHGQSIQPYKKIEAPDELNKTIKSRPLTNPISLTEMIWSGESNNHLEFKFRYAFGVSREQLIYTRQNLSDWLRERILSQRDQKEKYIKIKSISPLYVTFIFNEERWIENTLKGARAELGYLKNKIIIKWKIPLPDLVQTRYARPFLERFLEKKFHQYFKRHRSAMKFQRWFKWLDKIDPDFFEYSIDWFKNALVMTVKNTVILGALLTYFGIKKAIK